MSQSNPTKRSLGFESLERRVSLTSATPILEGVTAAPAEVASIEVASTRRLLRFVGTCQDIQLEREVPSVADANAADQWLENSRP